MTNPEILPHLLRLLDDDSPKVRSAVLGKLREFGDSLPEHLATLASPPAPAQTKLLSRLLGAPLKAAEIARRPAADASGFSPGQLVQHRRYGYRGVIVERDSSCQADEDWYESNPTQPPRDQPWYYVLVHNSPHVTYAAHNSLQSDPTCKQVEHPLVPYFFTDFRDGAYHRNDRPWLKK